MTETDHVTWAELPPHAEDYPPEDLGPARSSSAGAKALRYRPAARRAETLDSTTCHIGFRCVIRAG